MRVSNAKLEQISVASVGSPLEGNLALDLIDSRAEVAALQAKLDRARKELEIWERLFPTVMPHEALAALLASNPEGK